MIDINNEQFEEKEVKAVFNGGNSGVVRNCDVYFEKRDVDANERAPLYKLFFKDEIGATVDRAYFTPNEDANDVVKGFFGKEMKHLMSQFGAEWDKTQFASMLELLTYVIRKVQPLAAGKKFGVAVCFGTLKRPNTYLEVDGYWGFRNEDNITDAKPLALSNNALKEKIVPNELKANNDDGSWDMKGTDDLAF